MTMTDESPLEGPYRLSLVVPMYNESETCGLFFDHVLPIISSVTDDFEIICVNDGSSDATEEKLVATSARDARIKVINLSRNFGKEIALSAGIDFATGDAVIPIDCDLQDPPELIPEMVARWRDGADTVFAIRTNRQSDSYLKRTTAALFYRVIGRLSDVPIPPNSGDFRLMNRAVTDAVKAMPERNRFMKGLYAWVGYRADAIEYTRPVRIAGRSKWKVWQLWNLALEGIFSFSTVPLRIWTYLGLVITILSALYGAFIILRTLIQGVDVPGYASLLVTILFLSGVNMIGLGILGEYVGRIFVEVKQRPLYVVRSTVGIEPGFDSRKGTPHPRSASKRPADS
jgi:glycosyltransferase involved in cell wall biosynthesis